MSQTKLLGYILTLLGGLLSLAASAVMLKAGEEDTRNAVNDYISQNYTKFQMRGNSNGSF